MIKRILFILFLVLCLCVPFVNGATESGNLGTGSVGWQSNNYGVKAGSFAQWVGFDSWNIAAVQYSTHLKSIVLFSNVTSHPGTSKWEFTNDTINYGSSPFTATISGSEVGNGTIGYYRTFIGGVEQSAFVYLLFDNWNVAGLSGAKTLTITYNNTETKMNGALMPAYYTGTSTYGDVPPSGITIYKWQASQWQSGLGDYTLNRDVSFINSYTATTPSGLGIEGYINKTISGTTYSSQVFMVDAYTNIPFASDVVLSSTDFVFNTNKAAVYIAVKSDTNVFYNSSTLFASTLPTITPTPIPTPTGVGYGDDTTGTFYIRDGLNQTLLADTYIELWYDEGFGDMSVQGYTDSVGKIVFEGLTNAVNYNARIWKSGYTFGQYNFVATPVSFTKTFYMYPSTTPSETIPTQINVSVRVMDKTTYGAISGAIVKIENTLTEESPIYLTTNATGYVTFIGYPNSAYIGGTITKTGYVYQIWNIPYQPSTGTFMPDGDVIVTIQLTPVSAVTPTGTIVTPTPTPVAIDKLILTATPDSINLGSSVSLTGSSSNATRLTYAGGLRRTSFYVNIHPSTYPFDYNMIGQFENVNATYWKFRANTGATWGTPTTASPLTMTNTPSSNGLITYSFNAYDTTGNAIAQAGTDDVLVGGGAGGGSLTISSSAYDVSNGNHLSNFQLNITDDASGVVTEFGNVSYEQEITLPRGNSYTLRASKDGYISDGVTSGIKQFIVPTSLNIQKGDFGAIFNVPMFATGSVTVGNTTVSVRVYDVSTYYPLPNVQLTNSYAPTDIKYTVDATAVSWVLPQNTGYTLTAYKDGYCTITESKNTSTNSYQYVPIYMKYGSCAGATPTPTPTSGTPTPTITPIGGWGNATGEAIVCGNLPEDATIVDILKNSLACNGLEDTQSQNLGISMLIILFAAIVLGRVAKGVGVLAGVIAGTVLSTVAGFLPFWIIIVVIIIAGLVFAGKVFWSSGQ